MEGKRPLWILAGLALLALLGGVAVWAGPVGWSARAPAPPTGALTSSPRPVRGRGVGVRATYTGDGTRVAVGVEGYGTTAYVPDYARRMGVLVEDSGVTQTLYLYGRDCLAERRDGEWLYHLFDGTGYVRQVADADGAGASA